MSISSTTNKVNYTGNATTDTYSYPFKIFTSSDLIVTEKLISTGAETVLVLNTGYTVTGVGETAGGNIVLTAGNLPATKKIYIRRKLTLTQTADIRNLGAYYASSHEDAFDKFVMMIQQLQFLCDQAVHLPETLLSSVFDPTLPVDMGTANCALVVNAAGNGWDVGPTTDAISNAQTYAQQAQSAQGFAEDAQTAAESAQASAELAATQVQYTVWGTAIAPKTIVAATGIVGATLINTATRRQIIFVEGTGAGETDVSANPQIEAHTVVGAELRIVGANNSNYIKLETGTGLLLNGFWTSDNDNVLDLFWDGTVWREVTRAY